MKSLCQEDLKVYSSHNGFRIKSEIKLGEYNCNQDLVSSKTKNQIGFSILTENSKEAWQEHTWRPYC